MMLDSLPGGRASLALPRAILRVATEKAGAGMCRHGFFGVNIGLILPRLFKFSETVKNDVFLHRFSRLFCRYREGVRVELALRLAQASTATDQTV